MQHKNFDGIQKVKKTFKANALPKRVLVTAIKQPKKDLFSYRALPYFLAAVVLLAFGGGVYSALSTQKSFAKDQISTLAVASNQVVSVSENNSLPEPGQNVPNEVLFNLSFEQLENYLAETFKTPEVKYAELLTERKARLKSYLEEKKSPLLASINTLAELKHWKIVLAVSNSESSLGKRCYNNNCSGIGVEPGHPHWRDYESKAEWAKDLDKLIEKRYKDWTLEEMNGVYNKPGSSNWVYASKQILEELQERGIE